MINIGRSYASNQSDQAGAEAGLSTLATTATDSAKVGMSDPGDVSLSAIAEGGIVTGGHNLTVSSTSVAGYEVAMESDGALKDDSFAGSESTNNTLIMSTTDGTLTEPAPLTNNSWGVAIVGNSGFDDVAVYQSTDQSVLSKAKFAPIPERSGDNPDGQVIFSGNAATTGDAQTIYYGVKTDPYFRAGNYSTTVVYTITAKLPATPTITSVTPDSYQLESGASEQITIEGANLSSAYSVYLTNASGGTVGDCTNLNVVGDTQLTCTIPTTGISAGDYTIHVVTQGGEASIAFTYEEGGVTTISDDTQNVNVAVDKGMIPVTYTGSTTNAQWTSLTTAEIKANPKVWFDYTGESTTDGPHWANAVTVKNPEEYIGQHKVVKDSDILGFWVYIPRYAYKVMRRDAVDKPVSPQNFEIRFEKKTDPKKYPAKTCSTGTNHQNYLSCPGVSSEYGGTEGTAWATHPAFTMEYTSSINGFDKTVELDGIWFGKFETTYVYNQPTVLPNYVHAAANAGPTIAGFYDLGKSFGIKDPYNTYGVANYSVQPSATQNNQHVEVLTSHMITNSEWGAMVYLSNSKYGAGVTNGSSNVQANSQLSYNASPIESSDSSYGITGCGPHRDGDYTSYGEGEVGELGSQDACLKGDYQHAYNGLLGQLASTTNNVYGVYDTNGGASDWVVASLSYDGVQTDGSSFTKPARSPYANLYPTNIFTDTGHNIYDTSYAALFQCTWEYCGGQALHETQLTQQYQNASSSSWGNTVAMFAQYQYRWIKRGGRANSYGNYQNYFSQFAIETNGYSYGYTFEEEALRVVMVDNLSE